MDEVKLSQLLKMLMKRIWLIFFIITIAVSACVLYSIYVVTPTYEANAQLLINQKNDGQDGYSWDQTENDLKLINTYYVIVKSPTILNEVIEKLHIQTTSKQLEKKIMITNESNSKVINITVEDNNARQAVELVNTLAQVFEQQIPMLMNVDNVSILSPADLDEQPVPISPNLTVNILISFIVSLLIGCGLALVLELLNSSVQNEYELEALLELPVIGFISPIKAKKTKALRYKWRTKKELRDIEI